MKLRLGSCELFLGYGTMAALTAVLLLDRENRLIACLSAALLHELGHILMMVVFRVRLRCIRIRLFEVLIEAGDAPDFSADCWITLGGVLMNFCCAALLYPLCPMWSMPHLMLGMFNSLPVRSLDGGHLLEICLQRRFSPVICERILNILTVTILIPLFTAGIVVLLNSGYNYSLLAISLYLLVILFVKRR